MQRTRDFLYDRFRDGDKPDENDFRDLIDSFHNTSDDVEISANSGWYYYRFLPTTYSVFAGNNNVNQWLGFDVMLNQTIASSTATSVHGGIMNIPIPKGVSLLNKLSIKAFLSFEKSHPNFQHWIPIFSISLYKMKKDIIIDPENSTNTTNFDNTQAERIFHTIHQSSSRGFLKIDQDQSIDQPIDPIEDILFIFMVARSWFPENLVGIKLFGVEFE